MRCCFVTCLPRCLPAWAPPVWRRASRLRAPPAHLRECLPAHLQQALPCATTLQCCTAATATCLRTCSCFASALLASNTMVMSQAECMCGQACARGDPWPLGALQHRLHHLIVRARYERTPSPRRERRDVAITLANTEVVLSTLSTLVGCLLHAGAAFAYLYIFGVDVSHLVISLSSMTLAFGAPRRLRSPS